MNVDKRAVLIGMALGDGYIQVRTRPGRGTESRSIRVLHGADQRAYCEWKAERLGWALGCRPPRVTQVENGPGGRYVAYQLTKDHAYFGQLRRWLYPHGEKLITRRVLDMLTPEGLAIWYMDDGHARRNFNQKGFVSSVSTNIATMCSEVEAAVTADWFKARFDLEFKLRCKKTASPDKQFYIECNTAGSRKFASIIAPHVPTCMLYKLAHVADLDSHECRAPIAVCKCGNPIYAKRRGGLCDTCYTRERYQRLKVVGDDIVRPNGNETVRSAG